jgi:hypothetical protein
MTEHEAIREAVLDHIESWFDGDVARLEKVLHPSYSAIEQLTGQDLIEATAKGAGRDEDSFDRHIKVDITHVNGDTARALCLSHRYVETLQLVRTAEGWKVLNGTWRSRASLGHDVPSVDAACRLPTCEIAAEWSPARRPGHSGRRVRRRR